MVRTTTAAADPFSVSRPRIVCVWLVVVVGEAPRKGVLRGEGPSFFPWCTLKENDAVEGMLFYGEGGWWNEICRCWSVFSIACISQQSYNNKNTRSVLKGGETQQLAKGKKKGRWLWRWWWW